jgi:mismatch-specific thymine-DNA glycosylase
LPTTDYLRPGLDLVFVGINPGMASEKAGRHYAGPGNHFWPLLYESGIVPEPLTYREDDRVLDYNIGMTNMVVRASRGLHELSTDELVMGAKALRTKLERYRPKIVCFNGKRIFEIYAGRRADLGLQPREPGEPLYFVMPSTSPRGASYQKADKLVFFRQLKQLLDEVRSEKQ